jgi:hypothetical protein
MISITPRVAITIFTCTVGLTLTLFLHTPSRPREVPISKLEKQAGEVPAPDFDLASEISFERIYDGCLDCRDRRIVLRRDALKKFDVATITETDLHSKKERHGKLRAYYFNNLLKLIEAQGYFNMNSQYAMGWADSLIVTISVRIGDKQKIIKTRSEGHVPIQLWGIYYAIDGALTNVIWRTSP